jgi:hypothetical protein
MRAWAEAQALLASDPWLSAPTTADRALVEALGYVVNETVAGAA